MNGDMYPRPSRERIAEQVAASQPATVTAQDVRVTQPDGVVAWFGTHVRARLAVAGWTTADLGARTGDAPGNITLAVNGTKCPLAIAGRIAGAFGVPLAEMVVPYTCRTCAGHGGRPPAGTRCLECGAESRPS